MNADKCTSSKINERGTTSEQVRKSQNAHRASQNRDKHGVLLSLKVRRHLVGIDDNESMYENLFNKLI